MSCFGPDEASQYVEFLEFLDKVERLYPGGLKNVTSSAQKWVIKLQVLPAFRNNRLVAAAFIPLFPCAETSFDDSVKNDVKVACVVVKHCKFFGGEIPYSVRVMPEFVDFVFREAPEYAHRIPRGRSLVLTFTPGLMEHVMQKIKRGTYSETILKRLPVLKRRVYAHQKLVEHEQFLVLTMQENVRRIPVELRRHVADFLGLATSRRWRSILSLIERQIY
jgi:hypothetical protein